jgi:phosphate transport system permease protein
MTAQTLDVGPTAARRLTGGRRSFSDRAFRSTTALAAFAVGLLLLAVGLLLVWNSREAFQEFGLGFIFGTTWDPVKGIYGAFPYIVGTILSSAIAIVIAAPIGLLTAIFLAELANRRVALPLTFLIELLAAIPSVVIGLWGVFVLSPFLGNVVEPFIIRILGWIPFFSGPSYGIGLFSAGVILTIMILPTIVAISREVIATVPNSQREAMAALGATRWEVVRGAVLPYARSGIIGAIILGLGRALGETMAVTMVIGNAQNIPTRLFDQGQTIASKIATTFNEASIGLQTSALIYLGLILLVITIAMNVLARLLVRRVGEAPK